MHALHDSKLYFLRDYSKKLSKKKKFFFIFLNSNCGICDKAVDVKLMSSDIGHKFVGACLELHPRVLFYRSSCPFSQAALKHLVKICGKQFQPVDLERMKNERLGHYDLVMSALSDYSGVKTVPQLFVNKQFYGDSKKILGTPTAALLVA